MAVISPARNSCLLPAAFLQTHCPGFDMTGPVTDSELVNFVWLLAHLCCSLQTTRSAWGKKNKIKNSHRIFHNPLLGLGHEAIPFRRSEIVFPYSYETALISTQPAFPSIYLGGCCRFCCCWGCHSLTACASPRLGWLKTHSSAHCYKERWSCVFSVGSGSKDWKNARYLSEGCEKPAHLSGEPAASLDALDPGVSWEGVKRKQLEMDTCI
ncbi:uncharacterized protein LOC133208492 isoform X2 [Neopsephotus bourkii]|nr:uncharacterized protein LOC133208492 isoform X2 [Neopsephotus bourkii]